MARVIRTAIHLGDLIGVVGDLPLLRRGGSCLVVAGGEHIVGILSAVVLSFHPFHEIWVRKANLERRGDVGVRRDEAHVKEGLC